MSSKVIFFFSLFLLFFFLSAGEVSAQVVINEINPSGEWVELFKTDSGAVVLEGCTIFFHNNDSQKKVLTAAENFTEADLYKVINTDGNYLHNTSSDTVLLDCPDFEAGPVVYPDNMGTKSYARIPNGTGDFVVTSSVSQGQENSSPTPSPTPNPTPSPEPTSQPTATPTKTPTPSPTPTKTKTPTPKPAVKAIATESPEPKKEGEPEVLVLGEETETPISTEAGEKKKFPLAAAGLIFMGIGLVSFAGYSVYKGKPRYNKPYEEEV